MTIRILFLGTGAAEGWPGLFCECSFCNEARALGGKNIRTRCSIHIEDKYKVDLPPDNYLHFLSYSLNLAKVEHLFITHTHYDHLHPDDLLMRCAPFAYMKEPMPLQIYGNQLSLSRIQDIVKDLSKLNLILHLAEPFKTFKAGEANVTPLPADHSLDQTCLIYIFEVSGKVILHGYDSGWFPDETWKALEAYKLDLAILDCTNGGLPGIKGHMGVEGVLKTKEHMLMKRMADKDTIFIATHFSHNGGLLHEQLEAKLLPKNILVAFDGFSIEI